MTTPYPLPSKKPVPLSAIEENWVVGGNCATFNQDSITLLDGKQKCKGVMWHKYPLQQDDYVEISVQTKFDLKPASTPNNSTNAFLIQLSPLQSSLDTDLEADVINLFGLVVSIVGSTNQDKGSYIVSVRYFAQETALSTSYFSILSDQRDKLEGCVLPNLNDVRRVIVKLDFEKERRLEVLLEDKEFVRPCLSIDNPMRYISNKQTLIYFKAISEDVNLLKFDLIGINVDEKEHSLDIESELLISHHLVEEIFEKVSTFTSSLNEEKAKLGTIHDLQRNILNDSNRLELYASDLFKGTRKFQEYMLENLSTHKIMSPENMPKIEKIRNKVDDLKYVQKTIYDRFVAIQAVLNSKKVLKKTYKKLLALQTTMNKIGELVNDPNFEQMVNDSKKILDTASSDEILSVIKTIEETSDGIDTKTSIWIGSSVTAFGLLILVLFGFLIMRKITQVEKTHFG